VPSATRFSTRGGRRDEETAAGEPEEITVRIAFAGLATSHPFTDAGILAGRVDLLAWDDDAERRARFESEHPSATVAQSLDELVALAPDGVVVTVPTPRVNDVLETILPTGLPCFVNKPAAATRNQLVRLDELVSQVASRVMSTSVLRFAPSFSDFQATTMPDRESVLSVRATVRHDVGLWASGYNRWQDEPAEGGGSLVTMGLHGLELLVALLGPDVEIAGAASSVRRHRGLHSEDTAIIAVRWLDGITGVVEVLGATESEEYVVSVHTSTGTRSASIQPAGDAVKRLGYVATGNAFLDMVGGKPSPVPWSETRAALNVLVSAREMTG
jgi:predicted dehydrogenase